MGTQGLGLLGIPKKVGKGLLKPVVFDKVRGETPRRPGAVESAGGGGWTPQFQRSGIQGRTVTTETPAGNTVVFHRFSEGNTGVTFHGGSRGGTAGKTLGKLSDVFRAVRSYVETFKPTSLEFSAATAKHQTLYDRVAPQMARDLGGELDFDDEGSYSIRLD